MSDPFDNVASSKSGQRITINKAGNTIYLADYSDGIYVCDSDGLAINFCILKAGGGSISFPSLKILDVAR